MSINENWNIRSRAHVCAQSGLAFADGEVFYTALFEDPQTDELVRRDYSQASWKSVRTELKPFSFWKSTYEAPKSDAKPEVVEKESAEGLLRRLIEEDERGTENTRYILAVMLERKKILKHTATRETDEASFLVYEHPKSGEVYIIRDPDLRLDQVEFVQREVSLLLSLGGHQPKPADQPADAAPAAEPPTDGEQPAADAVATDAAAEAAEPNVADAASENDSEPASSDADESAAEAWDVVVADIDQPVADVAEEHMIGDAASEIDSEPASSDADESVSAETEEPVDGAEDSVVVGESAAEDETLAELSESSAPEPEESGIPSIEESVSEVTAEPASGVIDLVEPAGSDLTNEAAEDAPTTEVHAPEEAAAPQS